MNSLKAVAWSVGNRLTVKDLEGWGPRLAATPLTFPGREGGFVVLFRFGAVCAVGLQETEENQLVDEAKKLATDPRTVANFEETEIVITADAEEGVDAHGRILLRECKVGHAQVIASVLAKSAVLEDYEAEVGAAFERIEPFAKELREGRSRHGGNAILRELGDVLLVQSRMVGRAEIIEKPEITWDQPVLDRLYEKLALEFELRDREEVLTRKLELISTAAGTYLDLMMSRRTLRVEWYIVFLIFVEILILLYELFLRH
jgi:uncharacterized Rmd1/YagE family protein